MVTLRQKEITKKKKKKNTSEEEGKNKKRKKKKVEKDKNYQDLSRSVLSELFNSVVDSLPC